MKFFFEHDFFHPGEGGDSRLRGNDEDTFGGICNIWFGGICNAAVKHSRILNSTKMKSDNTIAAQPRRSTQKINPEAPITRNITKEAP